MADRVLQPLSQTTSIDYLIVMTGPENRTVGVAELKARLSEYLRVVRRGHPVTVCHRETPIARLVPYEPERESLVVRHPIHALRDVRLPPPLGHRVDSLAALLEERHSSR